MSYTSKEPVNIFWFRRDLRLFDNTGLFYALNDKHPVIPVFIFDTNILNPLENKKDARVTFIHQQLTLLTKELQNYGSSLLVLFGDPLTCWSDLLEKFHINTVFTNHDYDPYGRKRDSEVAGMLDKKGIKFQHFKDQVIFEKDDVVKDNHSPYTVFTPYKRKWLAKFQINNINSFESEKYLNNLFQYHLEIPELQDIGFDKATVDFPGKDYVTVIENYHKQRDIPSIRGTSHIGIHLRFGTLSIRRVIRDACNAEDKTWLNELIWREFYAMILWHFPHIVDHAFKAEYDHIPWRNNEKEFRAWCDGKTGYPLVDAGMRELNATGFMHNRVRMITASFLTKHLLIDWRWGEAYFAGKLLDYEQASNVGGWQWAAGSGNDAVPYFRIFNPELQTKRFDPELKYIRKWVPEIDDPFSYPAPIVDHKFARERAINTYKIALQT